MADIAPATGLPGSVAQRVRFVVWMMALRWHVWRVAPDLAFDACYMHADSWRDLYEQGLTAAEAFASDRSYWED